MGPGGGAGGFSTWRNVLAPLMRRENEWDWHTMLAHSRYPRSRLAANDFAAAGMGVGNLRRTADLLASRRARPRTVWRMTGGGTRVSLRSWKRGAMGLEVENRHSRWLLMLPSPPAPPRSTPAGGFRGGNTRSCACRRVCCEGRRCWTGSNPMRPPSKSFWRRPRGRGGCGRTSGGKRGGGKESWESIAPGAGGCCASARGRSRAPRPSPSDDSARPGPGPAAAGRAGSGSAIGRGRTPRDTA